jgi:hypothetical protein
MLANFSDTSAERSRRSSRGLHFLKFWRGHFSNFGSESGDSISTDDTRCASSQGPADRVWKVRPRFSAQTLVMITVACALR